jgi:hypothetical protein
LSTNEKIDDRANGIYQNCAPPPTGNPWRDAPSLQGFPGPPQIAPGRYRFNPNQMSEPIDEFCSPQWISVPTSEWRRAYNDLVKANATIKATQVLLDGAEKENASLKNQLIGYKNLIDLWQKMYQIKSDKLTRVEVAIGNAATIIEQAL